MTKTDEPTELANLADAPVDAEQGLSRSDAEALKLALGITTIRQLVENPFVRAPQASTLPAGADTLLRRS